jgi:ribonuclease P protein component
MTICARHGFPRKKRLTRTEEFRRVITDGRRVCNDCFVVAGLLRSVNPEIGARLGLSVGRRVGPAVVRNRIRRFTREVFRLQEGISGVPVDIIVRAQPGAAELKSFHTAKEKLSGLLEEVVYKCSKN